MSTSLVEGTTDVISKNLFDDTGDVTTQFLYNFSFLLVLVVGISLLVGYVIETLDERMERWGAKRKSLSVVIEQFYRELMIMGAISFFLFLFVNTPVSRYSANLIKQPLEELEAYAEMVHGGVFVVVVIYTGIVIVFLVISESSAAFFRRCEDLEKKAPNQITETYLSLKAKKDSMSWIAFYCFSPSFHRKWTIGVNRYNFVVFRDHFLKQHHLDTNFDFATYLVTCLRLEIASLIRIDWQVWLLFVAFAAANLGRVYAKWTFYTYNGRLPLTMNCIFGFLVVLCLWWKVSRIKNGMLRLVQAGQFCPAEDIEDDTSAEQDEDALHAKGMSGDMSKGATKASFWKWKKKRPSRKNSNLSQEEYEYLKQVDDEVRMQKKLYWFRSPNFLRLLMKVLLLSQAVAAAVIITLAARNLIDESAWWMWPLMIMPTIGTIFIVVTKVLPNFSLCVNLGHWHRDSVIKSLLKSSQYQLPTHMQRKYKKGDVIIHENVENATLFMILKGEVRIERNGEYLVTLQEGEIIGEMSFLNPNEKAAASVIAGSLTVKMLAVHRDKLSEIIKHDPEQAAKFYSILANKLSDRLRKALDLGSRKTSLLRQASITGKMDEDTLKNIEDAAAAATEEGAKEK